MTVSVREAIANTAQFADRLGALRGFGPGGRSTGMLAPVPSLELDFVREQYITRDRRTLLPGRSGLSNIITFTRASGGGRFNASGVYEYVGNNVPRLDYDPVTLAPRGLLIEEQRTNLLTHSSDFANAVWSKVASTVVANAVLSPDGTLTASKLQEDSLLSNHTLSRSIMPTAGQAYTYSGFVKAAERGFVMVGFVGGGISTAPFISVNLSTGVATVVSGSPTSYSATNVGSGWWKVSVTVTAVDTSHLSPDFRISKDGLWANRVYQGDGTSGIYIWGAQFEAGAFPTSYIPTVASQVTRSADVASVNTLSPWYNDTEGTLFLSCSAIGAPPAAGVAVSLHDGTVSNVLLAGQFFSATRIGASTVGGVNQALLSVPAVAVNTVHNMAFSYKANDFAASLNGATPLTDNAGTVPAVTAMAIGSLGPASQRFCGRIQSLEYYPRRLSNTELQEITA